MHRNRGAISSCFTINIDSINIDSKRCRPEEYVDVSRTFFRLFSRRNQRQTVISTGNMLPVFFPAKRIGDILEKSMDSRK